MMDRDRYTPRAFGPDAGWAGCKLEKPRPHRPAASDAGLSSRKHGFESRWGHAGGVVKLEFTPACQAGGRGFESRRPRQSQVPVR